LTDAFSGQRTGSTCLPPQLYSLAEVEKLLTVGTEGNLRARAFLSCVYGGGLCPSEATHIVSPRPSNRNRCPPATAVPLERRNGHAQALSPGAYARSGRLQSGHAMPPTADYSRSDQITAPYAARRHLGESNLHLLLLL
jgi:hypothetical protein